MASALDEGDCHRPGDHRQLPPTARRRDRETETDERETFRDPSSWWSLPTAPTLHPPLSLIPRKPPWWMVLPPVVLVAAGPPSPFRTGRR